MSTTRSDIIASCERVFDRNGFAATGMDTLTTAAGVSSRTLYKHLGNKNGLAVAVLEARMERFFSTCSSSSIDELFTALEGWIDSEGARGCLFLRAQGETPELETGSISETAVPEVVAKYRARLRDLIGNLVDAELGHDDEALADEVLIIVEGATSAASYLGARAVTAARSAASALLERSLHRTP